MTDGSEKVADIKVSDDRDHGYIISRQGIFIVIDLSNNTVLNDTLPNVSIAYYNHIENSLGLYNSDYAYIAMRSSTSMNIYRVNLATITSSNITVDEYSMDEEEVCETCVI